MDQTRLHVNEVFNAMRTNVIHSRIYEEAVKTIAVTSPGPREGKTTVATNFAKSLSQLMKKVVIIDLDLRRPRVHEVLNIKRTPGFTNVLLRNKTLEESIHEVENPNLCLLPSGPLPPNPSEVLGAKRTFGLISECKKRFDYIIIDTPPVGIFSDALIINKVIDGYLLVTSIGQSDKSLTKQSVERIRQSKTPLLGVVANNA